VVPTQSQDTSSKWNKFKGFFKGKQGTKDKPATATSNETSESANDKKEEIVSHIEI